MPRKAKNMKPHNKPATGRKTKKRSAHQTVQRQQRQPPVVSVVSTKKLPLRQMKSLREWVLWIKTTRKVGYRWFERFGHKFGWWQHIGAGNFRRVHATLEDYLSIKQIYEVMQEDARLDAETLTLVLDLLEKRSALDNSLLKLLALVRTRAKKKDSS